MQPRRKVAESSGESAAVSGTNQRRAARVELSIEIGLDDHTNFYVGFSENVSSGGLFVATYRLMPVGTRVALTFVLPDEFPIFVHGVVCWLRDPRDQSASEVPPGMGIEFADLGGVEQTRIQAYIAGRTPIFHPD
jgi:uncharacterized protein (TIGR02266 family)